MWSNFVCVCACVHMRACTCMHVFALEYVFYYILYIVQVCLSIFVNVHLGQLWEPHSQTDFGMHNDSNASSQTAAYFLIKISPKTIEHRRQCDKHLFFLWRLESVRTSDGSLTQRLGTMERHPFLSWRHAMGSQTTDNVLWNKTCVTGPGAHVCVYVLLGKHFHPKETHATMKDMIDICMGPSDVLHSAVLEFTVGSSLHNLESMRCFIMWPYGGIQVKAQSTFCNDNSTLSRRFI